ncbi:MAG: hypothetical protein Q4F11_07640, partial [Eubacteriales bacterium]|nr:hypothetical protein [Eubacteriales bacterium]
MSQRKYRPFVVALTVCLIWIIYFFFSNFNWQEYVIEELVRTARAEVLPVADTLNIDGDVQLSWLQKLVSNIIPCYGYVMSENQDIVTINMISADETHLQNNASDLENQQHPDASDGNAAAIEGMIGGPVQEVISRKAATGTVYNRADLFNNDFLRSHFYTVTSITSLDNDILKGENFLNMDLSVSHDASTPQILIFHT